MENWLELRTAYRLAKLGTVSAAAADLGVHRATVNRHVEIIEATFGAKLFQRHPRGYTLTETGQDLLDVAGRADELFTELAGRSRGKSGQLSGPLLVTSLSGFASLIMPSIKRFRIAHPEINVVFNADVGLARLEYGEAHVAIRAGARPEEPDYVVMPFQKIRFGLFAARSYIERFGLPDADNLAAHAFVGTVNGSSRLPYAAWMNEQVKQDQIALDTSDPNVTITAVAEGLGLGFMAHYVAKDWPELVEVKVSDDEWLADVWIVTHMDLHRTQKVQEFLKHLKIARDDTA